MDLPLVTCIMPTANRPEFIVSAVGFFLEQDYPNAELVIIDDGSRSYASLIPPTPKIRYFYTKPLGTIGRKRNFACENAKGEFIVHWDDDDSYALNWISKSVEQLLASSADVTGLKSIVFYSMARGSSFLYQNSNQHPQWLCGATLTYRKALWSAYRFANLQVGEDIDFLLNSGGKVAELDYKDGFAANLHANNTSIRFLGKDVLDWMETEP